MDGALFKFDLQRFAEGGDPVFSQDQYDVDDNYEDIIPEGDEEDEDVEDEPEDDLDDDLEDDEDSTPPEGEDKQDDPQKDKPDPDDDIKFNEKQQEQINNIVRARLERAEAKIFRDISNAAGGGLSRNEVFEAAQLWGFLKANPHLSQLVEQTMQQYVAQNQYVQPQIKSDEPTKEEILAVKEHIVTMRASDRTFNDNFNDILKFADDKGIIIRDRETLTLAYLAWKGEKGSLARANEQLREQRKNAQKTQEKKRAKLESGKSKTGNTSRVDYRRMSDRDILASEGLSLFTEE